MNRTITITITVLAICTIGSLPYISHYRTCSADNQAYQSVLKHWGKTNAIDLSRVLTRMQKDGCRVGGGV